MVSCHVVSSQFHACALCDVCVYNGAHCLFASLDENADLLLINPLVMLIFMIFLSSLITTFNSLYDSCSTVFSTRCHKLSIVALSLIFLLVVLVAANILYDDVLRIKRCMHFSSSFFSI